MTWTLAFLEDWVFLNHVLKYSVSQMKGSRFRVLFFPKIAGASSFLFKTSAGLCWLALERTQVGHGGMLEPGCLPSFCIPLFDFFWVSFLSLSFS